MAEEGILFTGQLLSSSSDEDDEDKVIDTTVRADIAAFCESLKSLELPEANTLVELIRNALPNVNSTLGRTRCLNRMVQFLKAEESLLEAFPTQRLGQISKKNIEILKQSVADYCLEAKNFESLKNYILQRFEEQLLESCTVDERNSKANRIALLAWLLVYPPAAIIWEKLTTKASSAETPAFIEQPGGPMAYRLSIYCGN